MKPEQASGIGSRKIFFQIIRLLLFSFYLKESKGIFFTRLFFLFIYSKWFLVCPVDSISPGFFILFFWWIWIFKKIYLFTNILT